MGRKELWVNPVIENRADPWMMKYDGYYYFMATVPEYDRLEISRAETIQGLQKAEAVTIWEQHISGPMHSHIWAPELHRMNGKWYIYFAAGHSEDTWRIRMYVLECVDVNPLTGNWKELGEIKTKWDTFSLDATVMEYEKKYYLIWAQNDPEIEGNTNLYIDELISPAVLADKQVMISTPEYDWERIGFLVNEGPAVLKTENSIYISYSASKTDYNYCMGLLTMNQGAEPLKRESWKKLDKPVFVTSEENSQYGPGHNSFVETEDGKTVLVYHSRNYKEIVGDPLEDINRHTRMQYIEISDEGIEFGKPVPDGIYRLEGA